MKVAVQYFARYREALGLDGEVFDAAVPVATVEELRQLLLARAGAYAVLGERNLMCARNQELCGLNEPLEEGDEVAFFPTVTGG